MKAVFRRAFCLLFCLFFLMLNIPFASAEFSDTLLNVTEFADWLIFDLMQNATIGGTNAWNAMFDDDICANSPNWDGHHHFIEMNTQVDGNRGMYYICEYCGKEAGEVLQAEESEYVASLPATTVNSDGSLIWYPTVYDFSNFHVRALYGSADLSSANNFSYSANYISISLLDSRSFQYTVTGCPYKDRNDYGFYGDNYFTPPCEGHYYLLPTDFITVLYTDYGSAWHTSSTFYQSRDFSVLGTSNCYVNNGDNIWGNNTRVIFHLPVFRIVPLTPYSVGSTNDSDTYNIGTRAASITGNYGIVNSGGTVSQIESQSIVNEGQHTVYNPVTNETENFTDWDYDYSTRTYNLTNENGDTTTVTYGDEYVTYSSGGNTTNIYYITNVSSDSENGGDSGNGGTGYGGNDTPAHTHSYSSEVTTAPTCTRSGVRTYTCSCGASYTEAIPATGHAWEIVSQQFAQYSSSDGVLLDAPYTIYECSVCGQQYRTEDESLPPAVVGQDLDLQQASDTALSTLSGLKPLYEGYLVLLTDVFPFLPPEIMQLIMFGVSSCVAIGIWKAVRR